MAVNHPADYLKITTAVLERLNSEFVISDASALNYKLDLANTNGKQASAIDFDLLNQQLMGRKTSKGLADLVKVYEWLSQNTAGQAATSKRRFELNYDSFTVGYRNVLDNMIQIFNHLKQAKNTSNVAEKEQQAAMTAAVQSKQPYKNQGRVNSQRKEPPAKSQSVSEQQFQLNGLENFFMQHFDLLLDQFRITSQVYALNSCHNVQHTVKLISYFNDLATLLLDRDMEMLFNSQSQMTRMIRLLQALSLFDVYPITSSSQLAKTIEFIQFKNSIYHMLMLVKQKMNSKVLIDVNYSLLNASIFNVNAVQALLSHNSSPVNIERKLDGISLKDKLFLINQIICMNHREFKCDFAFQNYSFDYKLSNVETSEPLQGLHGYLKNLFGENVVQVDPQYEYNLRANFELALDKNGNFLSPSDPNKAFRLPIIFAEDGMMFREGSNLEDDNFKLKSPYSTLNNLLNSLYPVTIIKESTLREANNDAQRYEYIKQAIVKSLKKLIIT